MKEQSTVRYLFRLTLTLFLITAVVAGLLGLVNFITADKIAAGNAEKAANAKSAVLPADSYEDIAQFNDPSGLITGLWKAGDDGYVAECVVGGSQGDIDLMVGVRADGTVSGVSIIKQTETAGLGAKATQPEFTEQFIGTAGEVLVTKDGGQIEALTGATITSRAVCKAVSAATACVADLG